jgi:TonB family protein
MPLIEMLPYLSLQSIVSLLMVLAVGLVAALALLGLRFVRRGPARFWLAPSFVTMAWLPLVAGASLAALGVVRVAEAAALVGTGSIAAVQAGLTEAGLPLLLGLLGTAGVGGLGLALLAVGLSRQAASPSPESPSVVPPAVAVASSVTSLGLGLAVPAVAHWLTTSPSSVATLARALAWIAAGVALLVLVAAFTLALRAPRGSAPARTCSLSLGALGALVACVLVTAVAGTVWLQRAPLTPVEADTGSEPLAPAPARVAPPPIPPTSRPGAAGAPVDPLRIGGTLREPKKLKNVPPGYPPAALRARVQGAVLLECLIGADGRVARVKVLKGVPLLDEAATEAVRQWEYEPTEVDGVPVPVIMTVTVNFKLS